MARPRKPKFLQDHPEIIDVACGDCSMTFFELPMMDDIQFEEWLATEEGSFDMAARKAESLDALCAQFPTRTREEIIHKILEKWGPNGCLTQFLLRGQRLDPNPDLN